MAENGTNGAPAKPEINYHAGSGDSALIQSDKRLQTNIGFTAKTTEKFEIYWLVPDTDEECKERYDCELKDLITAGVRQLTTRPDYKSVGFEEDGALKPNGHAEMQKMADGYKVGQRQAATGGQKAKAKKWDTVNSGLTAMGITEEEIDACEGDQLKLASLMASKAKAFSKKARSANGK